MCSSERAWASQACFWTAPAMGFLCVCVCVRGRRTCVRAAARALNVKLHASGIHEAVPGKDPAAAHTAFAPWFATTATCPTLAMQEALSGGEDQAIPAQGGRQPIRAAQPPCKRQRGEEDFGKATCVRTGCQSDATGAAQGGMPVGALRQGNCWEVLTDAQCIVHMQCVCWKLYMKSVHGTRLDACQNTYT